MYIRVVHVVRYEIVIFVLLLICKCIMYMYFYAFVWFVYTPFVYYRALFFYMLLSLVLSVWVVHVPVSDMDCVVWKRVFHVAKAFCK